jgi:hypothetical protein
MWKLMSQSVGSTRKAEADARLVEQALARQPDQAKQQAE